MKRFLPLILLAGFSSPAMADITHKLSSSVQLSVSSGATQVERIGTTYSVSGSGVDTTYTPSGGSAVTDGIGSLTVSSGVGAIPTLEATQKTAGSAFSFSQSFTQGSMTSTTETTSTVTETINSMQYDTGYQHVITGTNIEHDGNTISSPTTTGNSNTLNLSLIHI